MDIPVTERDWVNKEKDCLHLRFGVFICSPAGNLSNARWAGKTLHRLFRAKTKYWRSYLLETGPPSGKLWTYYHAGRAMVLFMGHSGVSCNYLGPAVKEGKHFDENGIPLEGYSGHPLYSKTKWKKRKNGKRYKDRAGWYFKWLPSNGFPIEGNCCPTAVSKRKVGGCGQKDQVEQYLAIGRSPKVCEPPEARGKKWSLSHFTGPDKPSYLNVQAQGDKLFGPLGSVMMDMNPPFTPRYGAYLDGCRTMLTTNLAEFYTIGGTEIVIGWAYSVGDFTASRMIVDVYTKWLIGSRRNPAPDEFDRPRFKAVLMEEMSRLRRRRADGPLMYDGNSLINPNAKAAPATTGNALKS